MNYPDISLHAISKDQNAFPKPCLYVMFEGKLDSMYYSLLMQMHIYLSALYFRIGLYSVTFFSASVCLFVSLFCLFVNMITSIRLNIG